LKGGWECIFYHHSAFHKILGKGLLLKILRDTELSKEDLIKFLE